MKVSLSWIFEHIVGSVEKIDLSDLILRFNESVAEIEGFYTWQCDSSLFIPATVHEVNSVQIMVRSENAHYSLPPRDDLMVDDTVLLVREGEAVRWARMSDCGSSKETLLPAIDPTTISKKTQILSDTILEIDNKSITHRPDLWSHRGLAREIAALYGLPLTDQKTLLADLPIESLVPGNKIKMSHAPALHIDVPQACRRLAAGSVDVAWRPSLLSVLLRLCRVDARPIDALVDFTNYTMLDYGQPMHGFDAAALTNNTLIARRAKSGEKLQVLDGSLLELHDQDLVLADGATAVSLAGVMGGGKTGISRTTTRVCIEAGSFEPAVIRHTVTRYGKRTESSMRFEKNLDPQLPVQALQRYVALLNYYQIPYTGTVQLVECGAAVKPVEITLTHQFIEQRLGIRVSSERVVAILRALAFKVYPQMVDGGEGYKIVVPSFRATKDIAIPEDIVEEIGRFVGYRTVPAVLPTMKRAPVVAQATYRARELKHYCSTALRMHEISSYNFYDESWLTHLRWQPAATLEALNPVSGNWRRLVTSLIPALLKAVHENAEGLTDLRYFEIARTWLQLSPIVEQKSLAGVIYTRNTATDFYTIKEYVTELCASIGIAVRWHKPVSALAPWYDPYRVAQCSYNDRVIGTVGLLADAWKERIVQTGLVGIFELDAGALTEMAAPEPRYKPLPKYPDIVRDVSVLMPSTVTAAELMTEIRSVDPRICAVELVDFFKRPEWRDQISLSFRYTIQEPTRTLTTQEADTISSALELKLQQRGGEIR